MTATDYRSATESTRGPGYRPIAGIRHSYADTDHRFVTPSGTSKPIKYGDRVFARLVMHGKTVVEFMISRVNDFTELIGELRHATRGLRGLARLYVRNCSRGWSMERPMMLYHDLSQSCAYRRKPDLSAYPSFPEPARMQFPWETH